MTGSTNKVSQTQIDQSWVRYLLYKEKVQIGNLFLKEKVGDMSTEFFCKKR
jgi:hypothetical protein